MCHVVGCVFQYLPVRVATLKAQTPPLSLNVLMLHDHIEQMTKVKRGLYLPYQLGLTVAVNLL